MTGSFGDIGTAHITVEMDFRRAIEEAQRGQNLPPLEVEVEVDRTQAAREVRSKLDDATDAAGPIEPGVEIDRSALRSELAAALKDAEERANPIKATLEIDRDKFRKQLGDALTPPPIDGNGAGRKFGDGFGKGFLSGLKKLNLGSRIFAVIKPVAFIAAVGLAAQAASAAAAGIAALVGSLSALSGALVPAAGAGILFAQSINVVKFSLLGVSDALGGLNDEINKENFDKLTLPARRFTLQLDKLKAPIRAFQRGLQAILLPGFTQAIKNATPALAALRVPLEGTAASIGSASILISKSLGPIIDNLGRIISFNNTLIDSLAKTGLSFTNSFLRVLIIARPLMKFMVDGLNDLAAALGNKISAGIKSGGLLRFFEQTEFALRQTFRLAGSVGRIFGSIFRAATPLGNELLLILNDVTARFADFLAIPSGQSGLTTFFNGAREPILAIGRLIRDITKAFFELAASPGLTKVIDTFRVQLLPALVELVTVTTRDIVPVLLPALTNVVKAFTDLAGSNTVITGLITIIGNLAGAAHRLFDQHPAIASFVSNTLSLVALIGGALFFKGIMQVLGMGKGFRGLASAARLAIAALADVAIFLGGAFLAVLGPAGIAVAAIGTAFTVALIKSERFRKGVDKGLRAIGIPLDSIRKKIDDLFFASTNAKAAAAEAIATKQENDLVKLNTQRMKAIKEGDTAEANRIQKLIQSISGVKSKVMESAAAIKAMGATTIGTSKSMEIALESARKSSANLATQSGKTLRVVGDRVKTELAKKVLDSAASGIIGLSASFRRFGENLRIANAGVRFFGAAVPQMRGSVILLGGALRNLVNNMLISVGIVSLRFTLAFLNSINTVRTLLATVSFRDAGLRVMASFLGGLETGFDEVKTFIRGIAKWIADNKGPVSADRQLLVPAGQAIMQGFDSGLRTRWNPVQAWVKNIGSFFKGAIGADVFKGAISDILLGKGKGIAGLNALLSKGLDIPGGVIGTGPLGFLHPTSGWADTLSQVNLLERIFSVGMTSGLRAFDTVAGAGVSQHVLGQAADFGTSRGSNAALTKLAVFTSRLDNVFKQVIWLNRLWSGGGPTSSFIPDHMDHVHLGWQARAAGGGVRKGQAYRWNERGAETLMPSGNGYVMNAGRTKELVTAIKTLAQRSNKTDNRQAIINVQSNATDARAVGSIVHGNIGMVFSRA